MTPYERFEATRTKVARGFDIVLDVVADALQVVVDFFF